MNILLCHRIKSIFWIFLAGFSFAAPLFAQPSNCTPNPVFKDFPGEAAGRCENLRYNELTLTRWKSAMNPQAGVESVTVEGEYWYYFNDLQPDASGRSASKLEVRRNIENAVKAAKGTILHSDGSRVSYRVSVAGADYWGESGCGRGAADCTAITHKIIKVAGMDQTVSVVGVAAPTASVAPAVPVLPAARKPLVIPPLANVTQLHQRLKGKRISLGEGLAFKLSDYVEETSLLKHPKFVRVFEPSFQLRFLTAPAAYTEEVNEMSDRVVITRTLVLDTVDPCDPGLEHEGLSLCFKPSGQELRCDDDVAAAPGPRAKIEANDLEGRRRVAEDRKQAQRAQAACEAKAYLARVRDKVQQGLKRGDPEARRAAGFLQMNDTQLMDHLLNKDSRRKTITITSVVPLLAYEFRKTPDVDLFDYSRPLPRANLFKAPPLPNRNVDRFRSGGATLPEGVLPPVITKVLPASGLHGEPITIVGQHFDNVIAVELIHRGDRFAQQIQTRGPTQLTISNIAPAGEAQVNLIWAGGEVAAAQTYTLQYVPQKAVPPLPGPYEFDSVRHLDVSFLTGWTYGRSFGNVYEIEFAEETSWSDRYYARFRYSFDMGFGMRWPFKVTVDSRIDKVYAGADNRVVDYPANEICRGDFSIQGEEAQRNAKLCAQRAAIELRAVPVDGDADFYRSTGLRDNIFHGKEFVFELGLRCSLQASIPGPNIGVSCGSAFQGFDLGQHYAPQLGSRNSEFMKFFLSGRELGLAVDMGLGYVAFNPGVVAQGDNGTLTLDIEGINSTPSETSIDLQSGTKTLTLSESNAEGAWGMTVGNPRYAVDVSLKPAVQVELGLDLIAFEWTTVFGHFSIDAVAIDLGRADFEQHEATNGSARLRDIGLRPVKHDAIPPAPPAR